MVRGYDRLLLFLRGELLFAYNSNTVKRIEGDIGEQAGSEVWKVWIIRIDITLDERRSPVLSHYLVPVYNEDIRRGRTHFLQILDPIVNGERVGLGS